MGKEKERKEKGRMGEEWNREKGMKQRMGGGEAWMGGDEERRKIYKESKEGERERGGKKGITEEGREKETDRDKIFEVKERREERREERW